jgi:hypothetical protein
LWSGHLIIQAKANAQAAIANASGHDRFVMLIFQRSTRHATNNGTLYSKGAAGLKGLGNKRLKCFQFLETLCSCLNRCNFDVVIARPVLQPYARITQFMQGISPSVANCAQPA